MWQEFIAFNLSENTYQNYEKSMRLKEGAAPGQ